MDWKLNIWGVRGSMPAPSRNFLDYGGNTSCVSVDCGAGDLVVFDAGSGLLALAGQLSGSCPVHIFISHVHIDHLLGLYTFPLFHTPGAEVHLYGEARGGVSFQRQLEAIVGPPYWPVGFSDFKAGIAIHEIGPDQTVPSPAGGRSAPCGATIPI
jgi:phosphoribosyl 1,2-cyclic phosphodiesterase